MNIEKAIWQTDGSSVRLNMPLQKVDEERRIVSGFATMDSVDTSGDIVLASASLAAFESFRGNIRLMHQPIPAGKLVNFRQEEYYDHRDQKFYQGIYVDVYVSKGAPEVWEMVLDGTLTGFSIGGAITDQESQYVKDAGRAIRFIKSYDLIELSLVDSPANQLCNVFSIQKTAGGDEVSGMITEVATENVFFCAKDEIAFTSTDEAKACNQCGTEAKNIGWFESDGGDKTEKVNAIVADFTKATDTAEGRENNEMADEVVETVEVEEEAPVVEETEVVETEVAEEEEAVEAPAEEETEAAEEVVEESEEEATDAPEGDEDKVEVEEEVEKAETPDFTQMFADLNTSIQKALETGREETAAELAKVNEKLAAVDAVANKLDELGAKHAELAEKFHAIDSQIENVEKRFNEIEKSVGVKKSGDLGGSKEESKFEKSNKGSIWNGRFFGSVDSL